MSGTRRRGKAKNNKKDIDNPPRIVITAAENRGRITQSSLLLLIAGFLLAASFVCYNFLGHVFHSGHASKLKTSENSQVSNDSDPFVIVDIPGKGKGIVAVRDIEQGERILTEKPIFVAPDHVVGPPAPIIAKFLREASPRDRAAFLNLSYVNFPDHLNPVEHPDEVALAIFQTNAVATDRGVGIFPRMARMNHGCSSAFNAVYNWRVKEQILVVHALKKIVQGEEILTTYTDTKRSRAERRAFLQQNYGFTCTCRVCSLSDKESEVSDKRLSDLSDAYAHFATWGREESKRITGVEAIKLVKRIWALENEEGYWSERGRLAADAAYVAAAHSNVMPTREWASLAAQWYSFELGKDSEQVREMLGVAARPHEHPGWGTRDPQEVESPEPESKG